jgi:putative ABC transport system substrate-binding protein
MRRRDFIAGTEAMPPEGLTNNGRRADETYFLEWKGLGSADQVLRGAGLADIPYSRQTKFELVLNRKTASSLGLESPPTLLTASDEVIE